MKKVLFFLLASVFIMTACQQNQNKAKEKVIGKPTLTLTSDLMTPEALWAFGRVSGQEVSPDHKTVVYGVSYYSIADNKGNRELYTVGVDGTGNKRITRSAKNEFNALWRPDGKKIGFLTAESGSVQLWEMNPDGTMREQITNIEGGITGFKYSPDQKKILYTKEVPIKNKFAPLYRGLPKASGRLMNDLMYRHWDEWVDSYSHVFVADYDGVKVWNDKDILIGEPYQSPLKPFGGIEQVNWSPDSKIIAYTCKKLTGKAATLSTNSDIYFYNVETKKTKNMTEGMMGFDIDPVFSPDGKWMAWESMEREGYESDQNRLFLMNLKTGEKIYGSKGFDQNVYGLVWSDDSKSVFFTSDWHSRFQIYRYNVEKNTIDKLTTGMHDYKSVAYAGDKLIGARNSIQMPTELYSVNIADGKQTQITFTNKGLLNKLTMGMVEERWMKTKDGKDMLTLIIYPPHFDSTKSYPTLLYCKGGPQGPLSQNFHYRWNYELMAANGYIIVAPNRRGVSGFGQAWQEEISGDYHGKSMDDYFTAIDVMAKEPYVDENRLGAVGASAGGWAVFYLAGHHDHRFKAFIAHDGVFNEQAQYLETDEMWFENWDMGGPYWDWKNKKVQEAYAHSPHLFVDKWDTPILVIHGERDFRITYTQGMSAFNAAILNDVPAEFLFFPDENHWVLHPQNAILWQRVFFDWLDRWLK